MPDEQGEIRDINFTKTLPWTELFRCFSIALELKKLLLAAAAILIMTSGWIVLASVFAPTAGSRPNATDAKYDAKEMKKPDEPEEEAKKRLGDVLHSDQKKWDMRAAQTDRYRTWPWHSAHRGDNPFLRLKDSPGDLLDYAFWQKQVPVLLEPLDYFVSPVGQFVSPDADVVTKIFLFMGILWTLATWAIFGGAITRLAAIQIARKEKIGLVESVRFSLSKFLSFFGAPLFPFIGVGIILVIMLIGSAVTLAIPYWGDLLAPLLWVLPLLGAFIMVLILLGLAAWPLMYATISTEGSDSFDALSRSYTYLYQRPWHYLWYTLVALAYGVLVTLFVVFATSALVYLAKWGIDLNPLLRLREGEPASALFVYSPTSYEWRQLLVAPVPPDKLANLEASMSWAQKAGAGIMAFWLVLVFLLMLGFAYSYFWTASTMIYFLLRKKVDDTDMEEVYLEEEEEESYSLPPGPGSAPAPPSTLPIVEPPARAESGAGSGEGNPPPPT